MRILSKTVAVGIVALVGLAAGCSGSGEEHLSASTEAMSAPGQDVCTVTVEGDQVVRYISVRENDLSYEETRTINMRSPNGGATVQIGTITQGSQLLLSYTAHALPDGTGSVDVDWGHRVKGLESATTQFDGDLMTGSVNDRQFEPFALDADLKSVKFVDGGPSPGPKNLGQGLLKQLDRLEAAAQAAVATCEVVTSLASDGPAESVVRALAVSSDDHGHFSNTYDTFACDGCKVTAVGVPAALCTIACFASLGIGCAPCWLSLAAATPALILGCEASPFCCPEHCGTGILDTGVAGTCCFADEACLDGAGRCCSAGTKACEGKSCCTGDETCIDKGAKKGTCCPDAQTAGNNCCAEGESPFDPARGLCCADSKVCGTVCCGGIQDTLSYCMNPATSTCCSALQKECNGLCCPMGQDCVEGVCAVGEDVCELPCQTQADCVGDSHLKCHADVGYDCCVYTPF